MARTSGSTEVVGRDPYVDWLRAFSLIVVVLWHWAFTILRWGPTGPAPTSPLGFTSGLWIFTWLLQVLPLFFYVGGHVHFLSWQRARQAGDHIGHFVWRRIKALAVPGIALVLTWAVLGLLIELVFDVPWIGTVVMLVISPLWFLAVYLVLILLLPVALWLHQRLDLVGLVWFAGIAMIVDVLRFRYGFEELGWVNMLVVWGLAYQAGFFYDRIVAAPRRLDVALTSAGLFGLVGLVFSGLYPGSMVGVPGDRLSNMAPPTFVIVALLVFQIGMAETIRPGMQRVLRRPRWARVTSVVTRFALPLFLFHTTGMALAYGVQWAIFGGRIADDPTPNLMWWLERPLVVVLSLLFTLPVIALFGRRWAR
jgi:hypothetical protein